MIIWGGFNGTLPDLNTGGRYDPATDSWTATSTDQRAHWPMASHAQFGLVVK